MVVRRSAGKLQGSFRHAKKFLELNYNAMSLYYEAAAVLANAENTGGSLTSRIFSKKGLKSSPGQIFALIAEASKWSLVLKDVVEKCGLLAAERKVRLKSCFRCHDYD
jgi:hypothetical protein